MEIEIDTFNKNGYLPVKDILTNLEVKSLKQRLNDIGNNIIKYPKKYIQFEPEIELKKNKKSENGIYNIRKIWNLTKHDSLFYELSRHPNIIRVVKKLLGSDLKIYLDQTLCKPPFFGSAKPPHQDSAYWTDVSPNNQVICWIALDDSNENNGCMRYIEGSHKFEILEHKHLEDFRIEDKNIDYNLEKVVPLDSGSCCFHHSKTIHHTKKNNSPNSRIGVTIGYMSSKCKYIGKMNKPNYIKVSGKEFTNCV